jgi:hypothetical protein
MIEDHFRAIFLSFFAAAIFCLFMLFMTGCAVSWPTKAGNVTLSFNPPPELINKYGSHIFDSPTRRDK